MWKKSTEHDFIIYLKHEIESRFCVECRIRTMECLLVYTHQFTLVCVVYAFLRHAKFSVSKVGENKIEIDFNDPNSLEQLCAEIDKRISNNLP